MSNPQDNSRFNDLGIRTISGLGLALVALLAFSAGSPWSTILLAVGAAVMLWEFHRMVGGEAADQNRMVPVLLVALGVAVVILHDTMGWAVSLPALAGAVVVASLVVGSGRLWIAAGVAYIVLAMAAMVSLRSVPDHGFELVVWLVLVVVATDVGGYFAGRVFGGPKLWPAVSPKKTWSGAIGGWVLALVVGAIFAVVTDAMMLLTLAYSLILSMVSQAGDLLESSVKRRFGVKDSGNFLPGHGGALDRFDGLMAAALVGTVLRLGPDLFLG